MNPQSDWGFMPGVDPLTVLISLLRGYAFQSGLGSTPGTTTPFGSGGGTPGALPGFGGGGTGGSGGGSHGTGTGGAGLP